MLGTSLRRARRVVCLLLVRCRVVGFCVLGFCVFGFLWPPGLFRFRWLLRPVCAMTPPQRGCSVLTHRNRGH
ncbi:hypothetical protein GCM10009577_81580 [Streptomyces javensis]